MAAGSLLLVSASVRTCWGEASASSRPDYTRHPHRRDLIRHLGWAAVSSCVPSQVPCESNGKLPYDEEWGPGLHSRSSCHVQSHPIPDNPIQSQPTQPPSNLNHTPVQPNPANPSTSLPIPSRSIPSHPTTVNPTPCHPILTHAIPPVQITACGVARYLFFFFVNPDPSLGSV